MSETTCLIFNDYYSLVDRNGMQLAACTRYTYKLDRLVLLAQARGDSLIYAWVNFRYKERYVHASKLCLNREKSELPVMVIKIIYSKGVYIYESYYIEMVTRTDSRRVDRQQRATCSTYCTGEHCHGSSHFSTVHSQYPIAYEVHGTYQKRVVCSTASSTVPVLRGISHALANSHRGSEVEHLEVVQHVVCEVAKRQSATTSGN